MTVKRGWAMAIVLLGLTGCSSMYYGTMEKFGVYKRDILVDRVKEARDAQKDAKQQFVNALEQFRSVVKVEGGELEKQYRRLDATLKKSESGAQAVRERIAAVENVGEALFKEWHKELKQYSNDKLRDASKRRYDAAHDRYEALIEAMKRAESRLEPALIPLRDQVLYLKHNLNARAISGLTAEVVKVETNVDKLVKDMEDAIAEADKFIATLEAE